MERRLLHSHVIWMSGGVVWLLLAVAFLLVIPASVERRSLFMWGCAATGVIWLGIGLVDRRRKREAE
jgi:hypothetical protein